MMIGQRPGTRPTLAASRGAESLSGELEPSPRLVINPCLRGPPTIRLIALLDQPAGDLAQALRIDSESISHSSVDSSA